MKDRSCVEVCPVDCIHPKADQDQSEVMLYIHPDECIDCGACESVCLESLADRDPVSFPEVMVSSRDVGHEAGAIFASLRASEEMLAAIVRAYTVALLKKPGVCTAEDRGKILHE